MFFVRTDTQWWAKSLAYWVLQYPVVTIVKNCTARKQMIELKNIQAKTTTKKNSFLNKHLIHGFKTRRRFCTWYFNERQSHFDERKTSQNASNLRLIFHIHTAFIGGATSPFPYQILKRACHFACVPSRSLALQMFAHNFGLSRSLSARSISSLAPSLLCVHWVACKCYSDEFYHIYVYMSLNVCCKPKIHNHTHTQFVA